MPEALVENMTDVLAALATGTYSILPGTVPVLNEADGKFSTPSSAPVEGVLCSVQEVAGMKGEQLPAGERFNDTRMVVTTYALRPADTATGRLADQVLIAGEWYEVVDTQPWEHASGLCVATVKRARR